MGIEVLCNSDGMYLTQHKYIAELLTKTNMAVSKPCTSLMSTTCQFTAIEVASYLDPHMYIQVVGNL